MSDTISLVKEHT